MFSLLWSEHCAYKHSRKLLRRLPTEGERVLMGPGENAGAVSIGDGWAVAFKVESHNHPSAVEPFQGAATGVGGILRDVFALGARPIAILDSLRFGELDSERSRYLFDHVVAGIGHYGNSIGVPTVGGEVYFEAPYEHNCLVNAMCVGLARADEMVRAAAAGVGNAVVLIGASTGRDGIGGASVLASAELEGGDDSKRPTVQIGDPFEEAKLLECCLELLGAGLLVSLQDLGAAGLTSSAGEMASSGGVGIDIDVARVPLREADMEPFEIMVSESQERMLAVVEPANVDAVLALCEKWETGAAVVGEVTDNGRFRVLRGERGRRRDAGRRAGRRMPAIRPRAHRARGLDLRQQTYASAPGSPPDGRGSRRARPTRAILMALLASPSIATKRWAFEQYDSVVGSHTVRRPGGLRRGRAAPARGRRDDRGRDRRQRPPGRLRSVRGHGRGGARVRPEPRLRRRRAARAHQLPQLRQPREAGGRLAARPLDPRPRRRLRGARGAGCRRQRLALQRDRGRVRSTRPRWSAWSASCPIPSGPGAWRSRDGDAIAICGPFSPSLAGSELAKLRGELGPGLPSLPIADVARGDRAVREGVRAGRDRAAPTTSPTAGLACALAEMAIAGGIGLDADLDRVGRGARLLRRDSAVRRGPGRLRGRRRRARSSSACARRGSTCS